MYNEIETEQDYEDAYDDYLIQKQIDEKAEQMDPIEYESKMAEQLMDYLYSQENDI